MAVAITLVVLLLGEDTSEIVWGATLILGPVLLLVGVAFWAIARGFMRLDARMSQEQAVQDPFPFMLRTERILVRLGLALVLTWFVLSAGLLLRGETLF